VAYLKELTARGINLKFPIFFPDATRGVVRSIDSFDLEKAGVEGLIVNTYHLMEKPGASTLKENGGIKNLMNWKGLIISDSGGFQVMSMIHKNKNLGKITKDGVVFYSGSASKRKKNLLSPEKSIQVQFAIGADIMICLDDFTNPKGSLEDAKLSVEHTIDWAKRCKAEFENLVKSKKMDETTRPLLFGVVQGGCYKNLREKCAEELVKIGFDGFGFGGWPMNEEGKLDKEILKLTAEAMPDDKPKYALGVGTPQDIIDCTAMGYNIFDCVIPTREARHQRLYVFDKDPRNGQLDPSNIHYQYILREVYFRDQSPISEFCDCHTCQNFSRSYLHHLFRIEDSLAWRLATIHNLRTYTLTTDHLRQSVPD